MVNNSNDQAKNENVSESVKKSVHEPEDHIVNEIGAPNDKNIDAILDDDHADGEKSIERQKKHMLLNQMTWSGISRDKILRRLERSKSLSNPTHIDEFDPLRNRIASIMSMSDFGGEIMPYKSFESLKPGCW